MTDLADLIARVEAATGPDREADRAIARMIGWHRVEPRFTRNRKGGWIAPEDFMGVEQSGAPRLDSLHGTSIWPDVPCFTATLDAALALAERVLPGWTARLDITPKMTDAGFDPPWTDDMRNKPFGHGSSSAQAPTPALALCLAVLRAKAAQS